MDARSDLCKERFNAFGAAGHADKSVTTCSVAMATRFKDGTA